MILVLLRLLGTSLRGRVVRSLRMLRQPKYLIGSLVGVGWVLFWVGHSAGGVRIGHFGRGGGSGFDPTPETLAGLQVAAAVGLALLASVTWLLPWGKLGLGLKEAELHVLLPAPVSRRHIIQYALLKNQIGIVITSGILSLFTGSGTTEERLLWFAGIWTMFNVWDLNGKLRGMFLLRQNEVPTATARLRRALLFLAVLAFWAMAFPLLSDAVSLAAIEVRDARGFADFARGATRGLAALRQSAGSDSVPGVLLLPFVWAVGPVFARGSAEFLQALIPVAGLCVIQHELIVRSPARFEEASLARAEQEARSKTPASARARMSERSRRRQPFPLAALGPPEVAILWKNTLAIVRRPLRQLAWLAAGLLALITVALPLAGTPVPVFGILAIPGAIAIVLFPFTAGMSWQNDFRTEFRYIELVRTWPVGATRFTLAQMLSPVLLSLIAALAGAGLIVGAMLGAIVADALAGGAPTALPPAGTSILRLRYELAVPLILLSALPFAAGLASVSSALQNLVVLFVPAWVAHGRDAPKGIAAMGQRLLFAGALGLSFLFVMIPSALLVLIALALQWLVGVPWTAWLFPVWGVLAAAPLFAGSYLALRVAAALWDDLDPAQELLEAAG